VIWLADTNVLLRWSDLDNPQHPECADAVNRLIDRGDQVCTCAQVLIEYWVTSTRPRDVNGFGLSIIDAASRLSVLHVSFPCLVEPAEIADLWQELTIRNSVAGRQAHDARIAALMLAHGVTHLVTLNPGDFARYSDIVAVTPQEILSQ
jgi:predicted nucleic acid-binding protein